MSVDIATYVHDLAVEAKAASGALATASDAQRQEAVRAMAAALRDGVDSIVAANELDMSAARDGGTSAGVFRPPAPAARRAPPTRWMPTASPPASSLPWISRGGRIDLPTKSRRCAWPT